ncbi:MAG: alginate export family protein [Mangrovibacterium sp.]
MKKTIHVLALCLLSTSLYAQENKPTTFNLSAEIRPRYELRDGYKAPRREGQDVGQFISNRVRLNMDYTQGALSTSLKIQDVGTWGDKSVFGNGDTHKIGFYEAWAAYRFTSKFELKVGRQALAYDDERIMGAINWSQTGLSHDAMVMKFNNAAGDIRLDIGASYNQESEKSVNTPYPYTNKAMQYLWLNQADDSFYWSFLFLNNGTQQIDDVNLRVRYSHTYGIFLNNVRKSNWDVGGALYAQGGKDVNGKQIAAYYVAGHAKKKLSEKYKLGVGVEILSGTDMFDDDGKNHSFDPIYGTNHKFNGYMDYFYVGNHKGGVGLQDYYAQLDYKKNKLSASLAVHAFVAAADVYDTSLGSDPYLGTELDLTVNYQVDNQFKISGGYSCMKMDEMMKVVKYGTANTPSDRSLANWLYVSLAFTPQFLNISK